MTSKNKTNDYINVLLVIAIVAATLAAVSFIADSRSCKGAACVVPPTPAPTPTPVHTSIATPKSTAVPTITATPASSNPNLLKNQDFSSGTANWLFYPATAGTFSVVSGAGEIMITKVVSAAELYQTPISLQANTRYRLVFDANSNTWRTIQVTLIKHGTPYTNYGLSQAVKLDQTMNTYSVDFTTTRFVGTANDGRLMFYFPTTMTGDVFYFDNIKIVKVN